MPAPISGSPRVGVHVLAGLTIGLKVKDEPALVGMEMDLGRSGDISAAFESYRGMAASLRRIEGYYREMAERAEAIVAIVDEHLSPPSAG